MLWYKGWLETRWRLVLAFGIVVYSLSMAHWGPMHSMEPKMQLDTLALFWMAIPIWLAGAGTKTQAFRSIKGVHGSMLFTLTLPVSRLRLMAVRAALGFLEMAGVFFIAAQAILWASPAIRAHATILDALEQAGVVTICAAVFYFISVLFATFLEDIWQIWISVAAVVSLGVLSKEVRLPASFDIVQAIGAGSPLVTHTIPWGAMAVSLCLATVLYCAALKIAKAREY